MALQDTDQFLVNRNGTSHRYTFSNFKGDLTNDLDFIDETEGDARYLQLTGGRLTGAVDQVEREITGSAWDLNTSNFWRCGAINVPNPLNGVNGQSGLIRFTATPTSFAAQIILPANFDITAPSIVPFYVATPTRILLGNPVEVS